MNEVSKDTVTKKQRRESSLGGGTPDPSMAWIQACFSDERWPCLSVDAALR